MKNLLFFAVVLVGCLLAYNYYYGDEQEKTQSEEILSELEDVGEKLKGLVMEEREKFERGKYDDILDNLKNTVDKGVQSVQNNESIGEKELKQVREKIGDLDKKLKKIDRKDQGALENIGKEIQDLISEAEKALKDIDSAQR